MSRFLNLLNKGASGHVGFNGYFACHIDIYETGAWAIRLDYADLSDISDWAVEGVMFCTMKDIMVGRGGGEFDPKANIIRAEGAAVFERYLNMTK